MANQPNHFMTEPNSLQTGIKYDAGKPEYGLLPPFALEELVNVLTIGALKYDRENWRKVPEAHRRYFDAAQRHLWAYRRGEKLDPETGKSHLMHAACCLFFMCELDLLENQPDNNNEAIKTDN